MKHGQLIDEYMHSILRKIFAWFVGQGLESWIHQKHKNQNILVRKIFSSNKKIHSLFIKGYNMAKNNFLVEETLQ